MATATTNTIYAPKASLRTRIEAIFTEFRAARVRRSEYLRTYAELDSLSDRDLADIGISRFEVARIAASHMDV